MYERRSGLSLRQRNTAATCFMRLRRLMASHLPGYRLSGETEADESCSGGVRKGGRGRCADGKIAVAGPPKRRGKVYAAVIPDAQTGTLMPVTGERVEQDGIAYTGTFTACNASDVGAFHHRLSHSGFLHCGAIMTTGWKTFGQAKRRPRRCNGIRPDHFHWFLKECERRLNGGDHNKPLTRLIYRVGRAGR